MKTIEQLEKEFDKKFVYKNFWKDLLKNNDNPDEIKNYIFQELLPQVLSEIIPNEIEKPYDYLDLWENTCIKMIRQKAKEMWINLPE